MAAARSVFRSVSSRAASVLAAEAKATAGPSFTFRMAAKKPLSQRSVSVRPFAEMSFCVESLLPYHTATASALMTSMLSLTRRSYGWLPEDNKYKVTLGPVSNSLGVILELGSDDS